MIRKLKSGQYRLYSRKTDPKTGKRRNLGTFDSRAAAEKHEREVQYFKGSSLSPPVCSCSVLICVLELVPNVAARFAGGRS
jgi:hypothetical protein